MSGADATTRNRRAILALSCVCVILAGVIVGMLVDRFGGAASPAASTPATPAEASETVVPAGETPEEFVVAYFEAVVDGDYATAYDRLPADRKAEQTYDDFAASIRDYAISGYAIDGVQEDGTQVQVLVTATMSAGSMSYLWTFAQDGDSWVLLSRELGAFSE